MSNHENINWYEVPAIDPRERGLEAFMREERCSECDGVVEQSDQGYSDCCNEPTYFG